MLSGGCEVCDEETSVLGLGRGGPGAAMHKHKAGSQKRLMPQDRARIGTAHGNGQLQRHLISFAELHPVTLTFCQNFYMFVREKGATAPTEKCIGEEKKNPHAEGPCSSCQHVPDWKPNFRSKNKKGKYIAKCPAPNTFHTRNEVKVQPTDL